MALKMTCVYMGFTIPNVYIRLEHIAISRATVKVYLDVALMASSDATEILVNRTYEFPYTPGMAITEALGYQALKTLPEFAGAIDV